MPKKLVMGSGNSGNGNGISYETIKKNKTLLDFVTDPLRRFLEKKSQEFEKEKGEKKPE